MANGDYDEFESADGNQKKTDGDYEKFKLADTLIDEPDKFDGDNQSVFFNSFDTKNFTVTFDFNALYVVNGILIYTWYFTTIEELRVRLFSQGSWIMLPSKTKYSELE
jgi:hypothetical protein